MPEIFKTGGIVNAINQLVEAIKNMAISSGWGTVATKAEVATGTVDTKFVSPLAMAELSKQPEGTLFNGKISVTVASNNLTVAIKGKDGNDPSATNPVYVILNGALRSITSAKSVTKNAGTNWCNAGSSELATKEIDYFVYLGYNATDGVVIGFSRIPWGKKYNDFSTTTTNEKYCAISTITNASANDSYSNIGRFAATLSAGAGYTWSVPTFTPANLIQYPIYETRLLTWLPTYSAGGSMTFTSVSTTTANYQIVGNNLFVYLFATGTTGGTANTGVIATTPFGGIPSLRDVCYLYDPGQPRVGVFFFAGNTLTFCNGTIANWSLGAGREIACAKSMPIA